jgi:hypothetical protein
MNVRPVYRRLWPPVQRALRVRETQVTAEMTDWHTYAIVWGEREAHFEVDGESSCGGRRLPGGRWDS